MGSHGHSHGHSGHSHGHGSHEHGHGHGAVGNIRIAFFLNATFSLIELVGGFWVGSVAIMADAVHDFGDSISLGMAWWLEGYADKKKDATFNFGYRRFSLLSALISGLVISAGSIFILYEAVKRFNEPYLPAGWQMMGLAVLGLVVNGVAALRLSKGTTQNERVLTWHLIEDILGWAVILVGAAAIQITQLSWIDPALAIGLALFVLFNVLRHLKNTIYLFLQGRPDSFDEDEFLREALAVEGIERIDHLAVWSLDGETNVLSARLHIHHVNDPARIEAMKEGVRAIARKQRAQATLETCLSPVAPHPDGHD